jgi:hypothetical protein
MMLAILLLGEDLGLLATRAAVLRRVDADVDLCRPQDCSARMNARRYDLLVLCHTLRERDAEAITQQAQQRWPNVQILQIVRERWMEKAQRRGIALVSTPEPLRLVERTRALLHLAAAGQASRSVATVLQPGLH